MATTKPVQDASAQIRQALVEKGYRLIQRVVPREQPSSIEGLHFYMTERHSVLVEAYKDGSCEVWTPLTTATSIQETIDAIPD